MKKPRRSRIFLGRGWGPRIALFPLSFFFLTGSLVFQQEATGQTNKKSQVKKYENNVQFAPEFARSGNFCIQFGGFMTADGFFQGLQANTSAKGIEYSRNGRRVETFPQTILIVVIAVPRMCDRQPSDDLSAEAHDFMDQLQFEVDWKLGMRMQGAKDFNREKAAHDLQELPLLGHGDLADVWKFPMTVSGDGIPLSAHLIVTVFDNERRLLIRLSARL